MMRELSTQTTSVIAHSTLMMVRIKLEDLLTFYNWRSTHIDLCKCKQLKEEGFLQIKKHPEYPLLLLNYTSKTQYSQQWCKELSFLHPPQGDLDTHNIREAICGENLYIQY